MNRITGQVRVGVIGVGRQGQRHCRVYSTLRHAQLMGVCDASLELGRKIARQYSASFYRQVDDLLDNVDAVSIATPTPLHFELAMRCLERGAHVLIEKPITETLAQAETLVQAAEKSGLVAMVGHIERFNPAYIELKGVLEEMNVLALNLRRLSPSEGSNLDVDVVLDLMIHDANLILDLLGKPPPRMDAYGLTVFSNSIDHAIVQMNYEPAPLVTMTASRITEQKVRSIEATAREAYIECDLLAKSILVHRRTVGEMLHNHKYRQESLVQRIQVPTVEPQFLEQEHFIDCIMNNRPPNVSACDGYNALKMAMQVREQIQQHTAAKTS